MDRVSQSAADPAAASASPPRGCVELICGCMFSGKTTRLLEVLRDEPAQTILIVKHDKDDRYGRSQIMTHNGEGCAAVAIHRADDILARVADVTEVIAIDEGHFYDERLPAVCARLAAAGKRVIVTALDHDMWGRPFDIEVSKRCRRRQRAGAPAPLRQTATRYRKTPSAAETGRRPKIRTPLPMLDPPGNPNRQRDMASITKWEQTCGTGFQPGRWPAVPAE
ncbi:MAG: hypothetical protein H6817_01355 [Phycisphaerales bacterium]|nr:hypothetical protein [Phycisphaerales bacterium]